jgi:hypothetical protein
VPRASDPLPSRRAEQFVPGIVGKGRIEEGDVEAARFPRQEPRRLVDVRLERQVADAFRARDESAHERRIAVDCDCERRAARKRLERQRARSGIEIERPGAGQVLAEPVEERLTNAVGRRPQARCVRYGNHAAPVAAADDANPMRRGHETSAKALKANG